MTSAEESDFFIQVALDKELRQELKAQRIIESALRKDLESEPTEHTALRSRVAASLAASRPAAGMRPMAQPVASQAASVPGRRAADRRRWIIAPMQWFVASGLALAFTVGAAFVLPSHRAGAPQNSAAAGSTSAAPAPLSRPTAADTQAFTPAAASEITNSKPQSALPQSALESTARKGRQSRPTRADMNIASSHRPNREQRVVQTEPVRQDREEAQPVVHQSGNDEPLNVGVTIQIPRTRP